MTRMNPERLVVIETESNPNRSDLTIVKLLGFQQELRDALEATQAEVARRDEALTNMFDTMRLAQHERDDWRMIANGVDYGAPRIDYHERWLDQQWLSQEDMLAMFQELGQRRTSADTLRAERDRLASQVNDLTEIMRRVDMNYLYDVPKCEPGCVCSVSQLRARLGSLAEQREETT